MRTPASDNEIHGESVDAGESAIITEDAVPSQKELGSVDLIPEGRGGKGRGGLGCGGNFDLSNHHQEVASLLCMGEAGCIDELSTTSLEVSTLRVLSNRAGRTSPGCCCQPQGRRRRRRRQGTDAWDQEKHAELIYMVSWVGEKERERERDPI